MQRTLVLSLALIFTAVLVASSGAEPTSENQPTPAKRPVAADQPTPANQPTPADQPTPAIPPKAKITREKVERASEIAEIRAQVGGLLDGSLLQKQPAEENEEAILFLEAVQGQLGDNPQNTTLQCERSYQQTIAPQPTCSNGCCQPSAPTRVQPVMAAKPWEPQPYAESSLASALRSAGRELDSRANDLEDMGDYGRADDLRRLAQQVRQVARESRHEMGQAKVKSVLSIHSQINR